jgi:hypothetical protein
MAACRQGSSDEPSLQSLRPSLQQLLKQLSHAFFKLIDTPEQTSLQAACWCMPNPSRPGGSMST